MSDDPRRGFGFASASGGGGAGPSEGASAPSQQRNPDAPAHVASAVSAHQRRPAASVPAHRDPNVVLVSRSQNGNPLLRHVRCVRWAFADVLPDFVLGENACAVFVSLRYHLLHPKYLATRIASLQRAFRTRAVLCLVDTEDVTKPLGEVNKIAAMGDCALLCAWSPEEAARYVETLKAFEKKSPDAIKERRDADYVSRLAGALTAVRGVNKVDASSLGANFGSLAGIMRASAGTLAATPGLGPTKTKRLADATRAPFRRRAAADAAAAVADGTAVADAAFEKNASGSGGRA